MRYCSDWKPDEGPSTWRNSMYSDGVSVSSTDHIAVSCAITCLQRAKIFWQASSSSRRRCATAAPSSCTSSFSHSSETWCWMMNSSSSWCGGSESGFCADSSCCNCR